MNFGQKAINYFTELNAPVNLIPGVEILNPYNNPDVKNIIRAFYSKFFSDNKSRVYILGINPGRFGGGITGISFTDPVALRQFCGIGNNLGSIRETSSSFIYNVIEEYGGAVKFYSSFYLSALYPFALTRDGKNYNFYDDKVLYNMLRGEMIKSLKVQLDFGAVDKAVICLGKKNAGFLMEINNELKYFKEIKVLEHPRYIMQYKMKSMGMYVGEYVRVLREVG